eukprot:14439239-Alexandrium_andersonii.AAC.1
MVRLGNCWWGHVGGRVVGNNSVDMCLAARLPHGPKSATSDWGSELQLVKWTIADIWSDVGSMS